MEKLFNVERGEIININEFRLYKSFGVYVVEKFSHVENENTLDEEWSWDMVGEYLVIKEALTVIANNM